MNGKLKVTLSKTSSGKGEYMQIMSEDMVSTNIVLIAEEIIIFDSRKVKK